MLSSPVHSIQNGSQTLVKNAIANNVHVINTFFPLQVTLLAGNEATQH